MLFLKILKELPYFHSGLKLTLKRGDVEVNHIAQHMADEKNPNQDK